MPVTEYEIVKYDNVSFWKEEDNDIIFFTYKQNLEMDISAAKGIVKNRLEFTKGKSKFCLIDLSNLKSVTKEAREYMSDPNGGLKGVLGGAFISSNMLTTVIVNFFFRINKPNVPARFFNHKEEALIWLRKIKSERAIL